MRRHSGRSSREADVNRPSRFRLFDLAVMDLRLLGLGSVAVALGAQFVQCTNVSDWTWLWGATLCEVLLESEALCSLRFVGVGDVLYSCSRFTIATWDLINPIWSTRKVNSSLISLNVLAI